jgi:hypothetical protein
MKPATPRRSLPKFWFALFSPFACGVYDQGG